MDTAADTAWLHFAAMEVNLTMRIDTPEGVTAQPSSLKMGV
jgi:hypothetical protein